MVESKGLKGDDFKTEMVKAWPYSKKVSMLACVFCKFMKAWFFWHWLRVLHIASLTDAVHLGLCLHFGILFTSFHGDLWAGRSFLHSMMDQGFEIFTTLITTVIMFKMK